MKIVEQHDIISAGTFAQSQSWINALRDVKQAISYTDWPHGSGSFTIYPESGKKRNKGNGVVPIKVPCINKLVDLGWIKENLPKIKDGAITTGDLDAVFNSPNGYIGFEWETGNISSSHRAINKLLLTIKLGGVMGGILAVPSNKLKAYLTGRIGNIGELMPYLPLWKSCSISNGALTIMVVEHDSTSKDVPKIPKGTDGRAMR